jgi:NTP pyrophosphatase (non-canonical NTP hydrolase)
MSLTLNAYQEATDETAFYPEQYGLTYCLFKLSGKTGELVEKVGKLIRDHGWEPGYPIPEEMEDAVAQELGDVQWYVARIAHELDFTLEQIAQINLNKLRGRQERGTLGGDGDNR